MMATSMGDRAPKLAKPGDRAPDFELPAADREGTVALGKFLRRGPVLLVVMAGLYCAFCRRHISQLRPACETLRASGIELVGLVIASPERARRYFQYRPPCFPVAAAPDRAIHRAYGLPVLDRTPAFREETERLAMDALRELGLQAPPGQADKTFDSWDGFDMTPEDETESKLSPQSIGYFLIGRDGVIRWARGGGRVQSLPKAEELLALV
jgi:peroxiredoxin